MKMNTKTPGMITRAIPIELDMTYKRRFSDAKIPEAYEALILDCFKGNHSNFVRNDELEAAWKVRIGVWRVGLLLKLTAFCLSSYEYRSLLPSCTGLMERMVSLINSVDRDHRLI